jgi:hypothetical protein
MGNWDLFKIKENHVFIGNEDYLERWAQPINEDKNEEGE